MTESTNPTPLQSQADQIKTDLSAMLLKAAQASAKASPPLGTDSGAPAPEQKISPAGQ